MASNEKNTTANSQFEPTVFSPSDRTSGYVRVEIGRNGDDFGWFTTDPRESDRWTIQRLEYFIKKLPTMDLSYPKRGAEDAIWYNLTVSGNGLTKTYEFPDTVRSYEARELLRFITAK